MAGGNDMYTRNEMVEMMTKANNYVRGGILRECSHFMRDKGEDYFEDIQLRNNGIMRPYPKDGHGSQQSPIVGNLNGLFFSTSVDDLAIQGSIYGSKRFKIEASALIDSSTRAYFGDFYCVPGLRIPRPHYITLILTKCGTAADNFCRSHLVSLDLSNNPFCTIVHEIDGVGVRIISKDHLHVEILYTEEINIQPMLTGGRATLTNVNVARLGANLRSPRSKTQNCVYCG